MQRIGAGTIDLEGVPLHLLPPHKVVAAGISHCPEGRRVFYDLTVRENLLMGGYLLKKKYEVAERLDWVIQTISPSWRADRPERRDAVGRRTADAGDCPGADVQAEAPDAG